MVDIVADREMNDFEPESVNFEHLEHDVLNRQTLLTDPPCLYCGWCPIRLWRNTLPATWARVTSSRAGIVAWPFIHPSSKYGGTPS
jgi:hypothetical protein